MNFLGELKRRNVIRVAVAYLVFAWLVMQILDVLSPVLDLPQAGLRMVLVVLALGFVGAVVFSWVFELTPEGLKRESEVDRAQSVTHITAKKLDIAVIALLVLAIGLFVFDRVSSVATKRAAAPPAAVVAATVATADPVSDVTPSRSAPRGSMAVLSFTNMSPDPENEYFADGIAEELLNVLSRIEGLKVASRTSAFSFKGKQASVREIAQALNVAHVLEGSVRKQGGKVRITAQLIDAATDQHLWSDTYDRDLTDIFAVQQEIAQSISAALSGALGLAGKSRKVEVDAPTQDLQAYELYLRGRHLFYQRGEALLTARKVLEEAVARDPAFAEAWAVLASVHLVSPGYISVPRAQAFAAAREAAERARSLNDGLALPYAALSRIAAESGDLIEAEHLLDQAIERDPRDSTPWLWRGIQYLRVGNLAKSEDDVQHAFEIDPLAAITHGYLGAIRGLRGDRLAAEDGLRRASDLGWSAAGWMHARFALADQDRKRAGSDLRSYFSRFPDMPPSARAVVDAVYAAVDDPQQRAALYAAVQADRAGINGLGWSWVLAALGMHREAIAVELDKDLPRSNDIYLDIWFPTARGVLSEPAFLELAERDGQLTYWNAKGFPDGCRLIDTPVRHLDCTERWR